MMNHAQSARVPSVADAVRLYVEEKMSTNAIAALYGCRGKSVRHLLRKHGVEIRSKSEAACLSRNMTDTLWTEERVATLRKLWAEGKTGQHIADALGNICTRCAIIGKARRIGLDRRKPSGWSEATIRVMSARRRREGAVIAREPERPAYGFPSLISFPPHLQRQFEECVAAVRAERGGWN